MKPIWCTRCGATTDQRGSGICTRCGYSPALEKVNAGRERGSGGARLFWLAVAIGLLALVGRLMK